MREPVAARPARSVYEDGKGRSCRSPAIEPLRLERQGRSDWGSGIPGGRTAFLRLAPTAIADPPRPTDPIVGDGVPRPTVSAG